MINKFIRVFFCTMILFCDAHINNFEDVVNLFPKNSAEIEQRVTDLRKNVLNETKKIEDLSIDQCSFVTVAQALDDIIRSITVVDDILDTIRNLFPQDDLRDAAAKNLQNIRSLEQEAIWSNRKLIATFQAYVEKKSGEENLSQEQKYFLDHIMACSTRNGFLLSENDAPLFKKLQSKQDELLMQFSKNLINVSKKLNFSLKDLDGLPEIMLRNLKRDDQGNYLIDVDFASMLAVLLNAKKEETRKQMYRAFNDRAYPENYAVIEELRETNRNLAQLLGFNSFAEYDLAGQMVKNSETVQAFLTQLYDAVLPKQKEKIDLLLRTVPGADTLIQHGQILPWNLPYLTNCYKKQVFNVDDAHLAEYFPVDHVIKNICAIYEQFLGLRFEKRENSVLWDSSLICFAVYENKTDILRGYLVLDLYPRPHKYAHLACINRTLGVQNKDGKVLPGFIEIIANFPCGNAQSPALWNYIYVETLFHEFGHAMHVLTSDTALYTFAATKNVKTDFVEVPSTMFESWMSDRDIIKQMSCHYKTGKSLSDEQIDKLLAAEKFSLSNGILHLIGKSWASLEFYKNSEKSIQQIFEQCMKKAQPYLIFDAQNHFPAGWTHVGQGKRYLSKYYCYLWSEMLSTDLFDQIKKGGLLNPIMGKKVRDIILSKGASVDPNQIMVNFLGREPNQDAFVQKIVG